MNVILQYDNKKRAFPQVNFLYWGRDLYTTIYEFGLTIQLYISRVTKTKTYCVYNQSNAL